MPRQTRVEYLGDSTEDVRRPVFFTHQYSSYQAEKELAVITHLDQHIHDPNEFVKRWRRTREHELKQDFWQTLSMMVLHELPNIPLSPMPNFDKPVTDVVTHEVEHVTTLYLFLFNELTSEGGISEWTEEAFASVFDAESSKKIDRQKAAKAVSKLVFKDTLLSDYTYALFAGWPRGKDFSYAEFAKEWLELYLMVPSSKMALLIAILENEDDAETAATHNVQKGMLINTDAEGLAVTIETNKDFSDASFSLLYEQFTLKQIETSRDVLGYTSMPGVGYRVVIFRDDQNEHLDQLSTPVLMDVPEFESKNWRNVFVGSVHACSRLADQFAADGYNALVVADTALETVYENFVVYTPKGICTSCGRELYGLRFKCVSCGTNLCGSCERQGVRPCVSSHLFLQIKINTVSDNIVLPENYHVSMPSLAGKSIHMVTCFHCKESIGRKTRFKCVSCPSYDLCETCEPFSTVVHDSRHMFMKIDQPVPFEPMLMIHYGVKCARCDQQPLTGIRFRCLNCDDYSLCQFCEEEAGCSHHPSHVLVRIFTPLGKFPWRTSKKLVFPAAPRGVQSEEHTIVHPGSRCCGECDSAPIRGTMYRCANCPFQICSECMSGEENHNDTHVFLKLDRVVQDKSIDLEDFLPNLYSLHNDAPCTQCTKPIVGDRFKCLECSGDLCAFCEYVLSSQMSTDSALIDYSCVGCSAWHTRLLISRSCPLSLPSFHFPSISRPDAVLASLTKRDKHQHTGVSCDGVGCGRDIEGIRWHCMNCEMELCDSCKRASAHNPSHVFAKVLHPTSFVFPRLPNMFDRPAAFLEAWIGLRHMNITAASIGYKPSEQRCHVAVLNSEGRLWLSGENDSGQCARIGTTDLTWRQCTELENHFLVQVACGERHTVMLSSTGALFACGNNSQGQLGNGDVNGRKCGLPVVVSVFPNLLSASRVVMISCGAMHTAALMDNGLLYSFGSNLYGQLGLDGEVNRSFKPALVRTFSDEVQGKRRSVSPWIVRVCCGDRHTVALSDNGELFAWGSNWHGQCAQVDSHEMLPTPVLAKLSSLFSYGHPIVESFVCGTSFTVVAVVPASIPSAKSNAVSFGRSFVLADQAFLPVHGHAQSKVLQMTTCSSGIPIHNHKVGQVHHLSCLHNTVLLHCDAPPLTQMLLWPSQTCNRLYIVELSPATYDQQNQPTSDHGQAQKKLDVKVEFLYQDIDLDRNGTLSLQEMEEFILRSNPDTILEMRWLEDNSRLRVSSRISTIVKRVWDKSFEEVNRVIPLIREKDCLSLTLEHFRWMQANQYFNVDLVLRQFGTLHDNDNSLSIKTVEEFDKFFPLLVPIITSIQQNLHSLHPYRRLMASQLYIGLRCMFLSDHCQTLLLNTIDAAISQNGGVCPPDTTIAVYFLLINVVQRTSDLKQEFVSSLIAKCHLHLGWRPWVVVPDFDFSGHECDVPQALSVVYKNLVTTSLGSMLHVGGYIVQDEVMFVKSVLQSTDDGEMAVQHLHRHDYTSFHQNFEQVLEHVHISLRILSARQDCIDDERLRKRLVRCCRSLLLQMATRGILTAEHVDKLELAMFSRTHAPPERNVMGFEVVGLISAQLQQLCIQEPWKRAMFESTKSTREDHECREFQWKLLFFICTGPRPDAAAVECVLNKMDVDDVVDRTESQLALMLQHLSLYKYADGLVEEQADNKSRLTKLTTKDKVNVGFRYLFAIPVLFFATCLMLNLVIFRHLPALTVTTYHKISRWWQNRKRKVDSAQNLSREAKIHITKGRYRWVSFNVSHGIISFIQHFEEFIRGIKAWLNPYERFSVRHRAFEGEYLALTRMLAVKFPKSVDRHRKTFCFNKTAMPLLSYLLFVIFCIYGGLQPIARAHDFGSTIQGVIASIKETYFDEHISGNLRWSAVNSSTQVYDFMAHVLLPGLLVNVSYDHLLAPQDLRSSAVLVRQVRQAPDTCWAYLYSGGLLEVPEDLQQPVECYGTYLRELESKEPFGPNGMYVFTESEFSTNPALDFLAGEAGVTKILYPTSGFMVNIPVTNLTEAEMQVEELRRNDFIDAITRAVFIEFNLYSISVSEIFKVTLTLEMFPFGLIIPTYRVVPIPHFTRRSEYEVVALVAALYFPAHCSHEVLTKPKFLKYFWNWYDILVSVLILGLVVVHFSITGSIPSETTAMDRTFCDPLQLLSFFTRLEEELFSVFLLLATFRLIKVLRYVPQLGPVVNAVMKTLLSHQILSFLFVYFLLIMSFSIAFFEFLGIDNADFSSLTSAIMRMIRSAFLRDYGDNELNRGFMGALYFLIIMLVLSFFMTSLLVAIILSAWNTNIELGETAFWDFISKEMAALFHKKVVWAREQTFSNTGTKSKRVSRRLRRFKSKRTTFRTLEESSTGSGQSSMC